MILAAAARAQDPQAPDFSGQWVLDASKSSTRTNTLPVRATGGAIREPRKIKDVPPTYPPDALGAKLSGSVLLEAILDRDGFIADVRVLRSAPKFDQAAIDAVWQWEYTPTTVDGVAHEVFMSVMVNFSLGTQMVQPSPVPVAALRPFGTGLGLGRLPLELAIAQDARKLTLTRTMGGESLKASYAPGAKAVINKLKNYGSAKDNAYSYTSRWDAGRLVTDIAWTGPHGLRTATEVIARNAETLTVTTTRQDPGTGADEFVQTLVYTRRQ